MIKLIYVYENGNEIIHSKFVSEKTMTREGEGSKKVEVYELKEDENGYTTGKYITTYLIR